MPTIQQNNFADQCVTSGLLYGVNAHYVMAAAMLRSKLNDDVVGGKRDVAVRQAKLGQNPSALQLYQAQWPDETGPVVDNLQKACDDTRQAILDAINEQLPEVGASSLAITDPKQPVAQQNSNPPASLHTIMLHSGQD